MEERLLVVTEGGLPMVEYLERNDLHATQLFLSPSKFKELAPYLGENDEILVIIKGLTDFTMAEVYSLFKDLELCQLKVKSINIFSNVLLGKVNLLYYLYEGDLFYPRELKQVRKMKVYDIDTLKEDEQEVESKGQKAKKSKQKQIEEDKPVLNRHLEGYSIYKHNKKEVVVHQNAPKIRRDFEDDIYFKDLVTVNVLDPK